MDMLYPESFLKEDLNLLNISMFTFDFIMNYNKESNIGFTAMVDVDYHVYLQPLHRDLLPFLPEKRVIGRVTKLNKTIYFEKDC